MSSSPASIKRIGSKTTEKRWRHHFPHYNLMGAFCCHGNQSFDPICPKTLCSLSLTPMMLHKVKSHFQKHINGPWKPEAQNRTRSSFCACTGYQQLWWWFDQKWKSSMENHFPITSLWEIFWNSRAANSLVSGPISPKFELVRDFMHVLVTCKYETDRIKSNREKVATHKIWSRLANWHKRYSSSKVWNFCHSRESNSKTSGLIWPKFKCDRALMPVLVTSNFDDDSIKNDQASMETPFSHYKSMGDILDVQGQLTP